MSTLISLISKLHFSWRFLCSTGSWWFDTCRCRSVDLMDDVFPTLIDVDSGKYSKLGFLNFFFQFYASIISIISVFYGYFFAELFYWIENWGLFWSCLFRYNILSSISIPDFSFFLFHILLSWKCGILLFKQLLLNPRINFRWFSIIKGHILIKLNNHFVMFSFHLLNVTICGWICANLLFCHLFLRLLA